MNTVRSGEPRPQSELLGLSASKSQSGKHKYVGYSLRELSPNLATDQHRNALAAFVHELKVLSPDEKS